MGDHAISVTLKGKGAYDPWIVIYGNNPEEVKQRVNGVAEVGLFEAVAAAQKTYGEKAPTKYPSEANDNTSSGSGNDSGWGNSSSSSGSKSSGGSRNNSSNSQEADYEVQDADQPPMQCEHGSKEFRTGPPGKTWAGWFCVEKKRSGSCSTTWAKKKGE